MRSLAAFQKNFPADTDIPYPLLRLFDYQNEINDFFSGHFEFAAESPDSVLKWFDGDGEAASQFVPFGQDSDGSSYCYWLYDGRKLEQAPIVFLGSEGVNNTVLADNTQDFLSLLAVGYDELGFPFRQVEETDNLLHFRSWLKREFGIVPPEDGEKLIEQAKANHPDLEKWVEEWQRKHFGK
jgi:hypothetical protein